MQDVILLGRGSEILAISDAAWQASLRELATKMKGRLSFMTPIHHRVRDFLVRELPRRNGRPIKPQSVARGLQLRESQVLAVLDDLERHLFFAVRNTNGEVSWAFPVTSEQTPHRLRFSTGERVYGA